MNSIEFSRILLNAWRAQFTAAMTQRNVVVNKPVVDANADVNADVDADTSVPVSVCGVAKSPVPQTEISRNSQTGQNDSVNTSQSASASMDPNSQTEKKQNESVHTSQTASTGPNPQTEKKHNEIVHSTSPAKSVHHRYSNRTKELKEYKNQYVDNVWYAHCKAALYRQQSIDLTCTAYQDTSTIDNDYTEKTKF